MAKIIDDTKITHHVRFTEEEDAFIRQRAEEAGMAVTPYIRAQAVRGSVNAYAKAAIEKHSCEVSKIYDWMWEWELVRDSGFFIDDPASQELEREVTKSFMNELLEIERDILNTLKKWI